MRRPVSTKFKAGFDMRVQDVDDPNSKAPSSSNLGGTLEK